jgi:predicted aspartyl protease
VKISLALLSILLITTPLRAEPCPDSLSAFLADRGFVEIELSENTAKQFEVEAELNGEILLLILDTGASHTLFSRDRLEDLGLDLERTRIEFSGIGKKQRLYSTEIRNLKIGSASTGPISIFAADLSHFQEMLRNTGSRAADGLIGADFLSRWSAVIEVKHSKLFLRIR